VGHFKKPFRRLFLVHGDEDVLEDLAAELRKDKGRDVVVPGPGATFSLD